jgi:hypothetical protein
MRIPVLTGPRHAVSSWSTLSLDSLSLIHPKVVICFTYLDAF